MTQTPERTVEKTGWFVLSKSETVALQITFVVLCLLIRVTQFVVAQETALELTELLGFTLIVAATVFAVLGPDAQRSSGWIFVILPSLDFLGIALMRLQHPAWGVSSFLLAMLLLIPTHWFGSNPQVRGLYLSIPLAFVVVIPEQIRTFSGGADGDHSGDLIATLSVGLFPLLTLTAAIYFRTAQGRINLSRWGHETFSNSRKLAQVSEIETARLLTTVLDSVDVGIVVFGPTLEPFVMNQWIQKRLARRAPGVEPWHALLNLHPLQADRKTPFLAGSDPLSRGARGQIIDGETFWLGENPKEQTAISLTTSPVKNGWQKGRAGILLVFTDVTVFLDALDKQNAFVGTVSHELRTPLTTILGYLEMIMDGTNNLPGEVRNYLTTISENANRQLMLVNDLLEVSQARGRALVLNYDAVDLGFMVAEAVKNAQESIVEKDLRVTVEADHCLCQLDPRRVAEVIENLLSNAVRYTSAGGHISLETKEIPATKTTAQRIRLTVADNGIGIPVNEQPNLFNEFFRAQNARAAAIPGAGLGLFIVKKIVDAHDGTISVKSTLNEGTTVTVEFPCQPLVGHPLEADQR